MTENILNFYRGFWVSPCLPQVDKTLKMVWVQNIPSEMKAHFENGLFFLHMTSESFLLQRTWADFMHDLKYIKKAVTVLFSCFLVVLQQVVKTFHAPILFTGVHRIIVNALLLLQGQCFPESWIQSRTSLGKTFPIKTLEYASFLSKDVPPLLVSWLCLPCHMCFYVSRGVENWIALKGQVEENWLFLTSAHSSSTRRENFKFWNLLFSY